MYFTADSHYGSQRTLELSRRPFDTVAEMDAAMLAHTNAIIPTNGLLYHVGDFGEYSMVRNITARVVLVCGNYEWNDINTKFDRDFEKFRRHLLDLGFHDVYAKGTEMAYRQGDSRESLWLDHYPTNSRSDMFNLFGHVHALRMVTENGLNVGVDCHHFRPISLETVNFFRNGIENVFDEDVFGEHHAKKSISNSY